MEKVSGIKRALRLFVIAALIVISLFAFTACGYDAVLFDGVDFKESAFKHITNGGQDGDSPYNISAITGATLTVEGPAVKASVPMSTKELENTNDGLVRGLYKDKTGKRVYEGMDVYYLLTKMSEGDKGIILTDKAYKVVFKDCNRETIAELTVKDIEKAHKDKQPVIIAYGTADEKQESVVPFVFSGANEGEHTLGYVEALNNEDGCLKLVYNTTKYGKNKKYKKYSNIAYVYVCEEKEPGFKHSEESGKDYASPKYKDYVISVGGKTLGYQMDFTVEQLEALVSYDKKGNVKEGGMGYKDFYSLANNTYWYVNEYEGLDLYKFLKYVGMPSAEELGEEASETYVTFRASDGFASAEKFDVLTLSDPNNFGYYKKSSADLNDGKYVSNAADLVKTGYPVLLAYGVNNYPYTITADDPGYLSGLSNNGGPMRIIFGKKEYSHVNGSNQIQYLSEIAVGSNILYNTHTYTKDADHKELRDEEINIVVNNIDGSKLTDKRMSVRDIEDLIYGEDTSAKDAGEAKEKGVYEVKNGDKYESDVYEGVSLEYFLSDVIGIPGTNGTVTFSDGKNEIKLELTDLFKKGYNTEKGIDGQASILAFAKNGAPLVKNEKSKGYIASRKLNAVSKTDPTSYKVENKGGPLAVLIPSSDEKKANGKAVFDVKTITVNVEPDKYAHLSGDSVKYADETIKFYGEGLTKSVEYKVSDIEGMQKLARTLDFSILDGKGILKNERYRGIGLYDLMMGVGVNYNAHEVILHARDGSTMTFPLSDIRKKDYKNFADKNCKDPLAPFIAYGQGDVKKALKEGAPLTAESGGPLKFIMPQANDKTQNAKLCIKDIAAVEVTAIEMESWGHASNDIYSDFLSYEFEVVVKNDTNEWSKKLTLRELEEMEDCVTRSDYTVLDLGTCEGIDIWKLVKAVAGDIPGVDNPVAVTGFANDGYSKDFLSIFYEDGVKNGVPDASGNRKPILLCYAIGGYPLVDSEDHEGYTSLVGNAFGPLRFIAETNQGASIKYASKLVVTISGSGEIK